MRKLKGFTLIELLVTIAIVAVLSSIILFSITQYINRGKDAAIAGNLTALIPAGEIFYDHNDGNGYGIGKNIDGVITGKSFCGSSAVENAFSQSPSEKKYCNSATNIWSSCARLSLDSDRAFCVDSRGIKREIADNECKQDIEYCPTD